MRDCRLLFALLEATQVYVQHVHRGLTRVGTSTGCCGVAGLQNLFCNVCQRVLTQLMRRRDAATDPGESTASLSMCPGAPAGSTNRKWKGSIVLFEVCEGGLFEAGKQTSEMGKSDTKMKGSINRPIVKSVSVS